MWAYDSTENELSTNCPYTYDDYDDNDDDDDDDIGFIWHNSRTM